MFSGFDVRDDMKTADGSFRIEFQHTSPSREAAGIHNGIGYIGGVIGTSAETRIWYSEA